MNRLLAPISELQRILSPAYRPCDFFSAPCTTMRFRPADGHVPRGFTGAYGERQDVELILVLAEPGDPASSAERYSPQDVRKTSFVGLLSRLVMSALEQRISPFHRNLRLILDSFWPGLPLEQQLRKTWIAESVLCSAQESAGRVSPETEIACGENYLRKQIRLFPSATIVALGGKAKSRLKKCGLIPHILAHAPGRPGGSKPAARKSWAEAARHFHQRIGFTAVPSLVATEKLEPLPSTLSGMLDDIMPDAEQIVAQWKATETCKRNANGTIHAGLSGGISLYVNLRKTPVPHFLLHIRRKGSNHLQWATQHAAALGGHVKRATTVGHEACVESRLSNTSDLARVLENLERISGVGSNERPNGSESI